MASLTEQFPQYNFEKVILRKLNKDDIEDMTEYLTDKEVNKFLPDDAEMDNKKEIKAMIESVNQGFMESNKIRWGIVDKERAKVIGDCGFYKIDLKK